MAEDTSVAAGGIGQYSRDVIDELKKIQSPTRHETIQTTLVTLFILFFVSICLFFMDVIFGRLMGAILT